MTERAVRISTVESVGPDAIVVGLEPPPEFDARPGQFVKLTATVDGESISRYFSISSPSPADRLEVTVALHPDGTLGPWLAERDVGATVVLDGPYGTVYYEGEPRVVALAGGPGIGAASAIVERAVSDGADAAIVYRDESPIHESRLAALSAAGAEVVITGTDAAFTAAVARIDLRDGQAFVYGFPAFLQTALAAIEAAGGDPDRAKVENFG